MFLHTQSFPLTEKSKLGLWQKHIFCPNASIFLDLGYDWYFILRLLASSIKYYSRVRKRSFKDFEDYFIAAEIRINYDHKISMVSKVKKIDALGQEICFCQTLYSLNIFVATSSCSIRPIKPSRITAPCSTLC